MRLSDAATELVRLRARGDIYHEKEHCPFRFPFDPSTLVQLASRRQSFILTLNQITGLRLAGPVHGGIRGRVADHTTHDPTAVLSMPLSDDTTELLRALCQGDDRALDRLTPRVYDELHRIAHRELARRGAGGTLRTTDLLHEAYVKLVDQTRVEVDDRAHFLALAATAMRHIVIDYARKRQSQKRGGEWRRISLDDGVPASEDRFTEIIELDEALRRLERFDRRLCKIVECRFFGGMTVPETAAALSIAPRTVDRAWQRAKAWLYREIHEA